MLSGDYQAADLDLKKLARHRVYTVRVNRSDRLLFTTVTIKGQPYLLLLEVIFNHDYQKSRFLKSYVLKQYLDTNIEALEETIISEESFLTCIEAPLTSKSMVREGEKLKFSSVEFYNNNFVEINDHQSQAIRIDLPAVISGTAGSGKTLVLFQILVKLAIKGAEPVVYVTQSDTLISNVKAMWEESPYSQGIPKNRVEFKTYIQFMHRLESTSKDKTLVGEDHFNDWIEKKYLVHYRFREKITR